MAGMAPANELDIFREVMEGLEQNSCEGYVVVEVVVVVLVLVLLLVLVVLVVVVVVVLEVVVLEVVLVL